MANTPRRFAGLAVTDEADLTVDVADVTGLAEFLLVRLGMAADVELSILLVDEEAMARLHVEWMDEPGPTDVISFPMDELREPAPGEPPPGGVLGDIVVCPAVAHRQAVAAGHSPRHEIRILVTHGLLHLLGHDHADPDSERAMFARQERLVAEYAAARAEEPERGTSP